MVAELLSCAGGRQQLGELGLVSKADKTGRSAASAIRPRARVSGTKGRPSSAVSVSRGKPSNDSRAELRQ